VAKLLTFALALSFDSFLVSVALGALGVERSTKRKLVVWFGVCDSLASVAGCSLSMGFAGHEREKFLPFVLCLYLVVIFSFAAYTRTIKLHRPSPNIFYVLPFVLSFDNLVAGMSLDLPALSLPVFTMIVGSASALAALFGLQLGLLARRHLPIRALRFAGIGLLFLVTGLQLL
jgi:putative Mn2+ efflux pump MntP